MSGIVGQINTKKTLNKMLDVIPYRGKYQRFYNDGFISLAKCSFDKKAINETKEYIVLFDGNTQHKSKSNEEYIVNLYKKYQEDAFNKIKGSFSVCIYDKKKQKMVLARDKFGRKPLYYTKEKFMFASEIKCILENEDYDKKLNEDILKDMFLYQTNPNEETIFKGIYKVPAGGYAVYEDGKIKTLKYYNFMFNNLVYDEDELVEKIKTAVKTNFKFQKDKASFLSSGIDSSLIVSASKVKDTYTIGYQDEEFSESYHTNSLCKVLDINNNVKYLSKDEFLKEIRTIQIALDEPCMDPAVIALYFGAKEASLKYNKIYSGEGADELFGGYNTYLDVIKYHKYRKLPKWFKKLIFKICNKLPEIKGVNFLLRRTSNINEYYAGVARIFNERTLNKLLKTNKNSNLIKYNKVIKNDYDELEQMQIVDINYWLNAEINATERMCIINNLEVSMPFLSDEMVDIASKVPTSFKIKGNMTKTILRQAAKEIIPNNAYQNKKLGFPVPIRKWIRTEEYYKEFLKVLTSKESKEFFNQKFLLKMLNDTYVGKKDYSKQVFSIYSFLIWYQEYFDN